MIDFSVATRLTVWSWTRHVARAYLVWPLYCHWAGSCQAANI